MKRAVMFVLGAAAYASWGLLLLIMILDYTGGPHA